MVGELYLSSRATFVCLALARPRPMAGPPYNREGAAGCLGGPIHLNNLVVFTVPCERAGVRRGIGDVTSHASEVTRWTDPSGMPPERCALPPAVSTTRSDGCGLDHLGAQATSHTECGLRTGRALCEVRAGCAKCGESAH